MSATSGSFSPGLSADLTKEVEAFTYVIAAGAGVAGVVNPSQPQQAFTLFNNSQNYVRGVITFTAGITSLTAAAQRVFLVPPGGTLSHDFADEGATDSVAGSIGAIDSISLAPVTVPAAAGVVEVSTLALAAAAQAGVVVVDFISS